MIILQISKAKLYLISMKYNLRCVKEFRAMDIVDLVLLIFAEVKVYPWASIRYWIFVLLA